MRSIFVSSTFQDMQAERDMLRQKVFPAINKEAGAHNDHIEFIDLRWGIDTKGQSEQDASIKVMDVCLNELQRSDDLMIILLGDRYGWIPDPKYMKQLRSDHDIELETDGMSATAFEIENGVIHGNKKALVYIREIADPEQADIPAEFWEKDAESRRRLEELKGRLKNSPNCRVSVYPAHLKDGRVAEADLDVLSERMIKDLENAYWGEWEGFDRLSDFSKEQQIQWGFIERKAMDFCARSKEADTLMQNVRSWISVSPPDNRKMRKEEHMHFVIGPSGSGKSTFLSEIATRLRRDGWDVLPFVGGLTPESSDSMRILRGIVYYLEEQLGLEHQAWFGRDEDPAAKTEGASIKEMSGQMLKKRLLKIAEQYAKDHKPLIVVIDALDQLYPDENRDERVFCPSGLKGNIRFLVTCTPDIGTGIAAKTVLDDISEKDRNLIVRSALKRRGKDLSEEVIHTLLKKKDAGSPLYISLVIDRLMLMDRKDYQKIKKEGGGSEAIASHQNEIIGSLPDGLTEMAAALFDAAGEKIGQSFTQKALRFLAVSRKGLRESDLAYCLEDDWNYVDFSNLLFYLDDQFLMGADGRIDFVHKVLRQGIMSAVPDADALHLTLEWCFHRCETQDPVKAAEILYHCYCRNDYKYASSVIMPIVNQDYAEDKNVLSVTNKRFAQTMADLSMQDQGNWVEKWLQFLKKYAEKNSDQGENNAEWNRLWRAIWFLNRYVLDALPDTKSGNETGGTLTHYMTEAADHAQPGTWREENIQYIRDENQRKKASYLITVGDKWKARIEQKRVFERTRAHYESLAVKDYAEWYRMLIDNYNYMVAIKGSSDQNVLRSALEPASYGIGLLSESTFVEKNLSLDGCVIGKLYGCIGEVCQNLRAFDANLAAYEQDLRYREEIYNRSKSAKALRDYSGSYHNISVVYNNIGLEGKDDFDDVYSDRTVFFKDEKYPIKLLPFTRFASRTDKTEGERFMDRCHEETPIVASLMARNRNIELIEKALEMEPDAKWNLLMQKNDALWCSYWRYGVSYLNGLCKWDPTDERQTRYFCLNNTRTALQRLCKALEYSWECFIDDPTMETTVIIQQVLDSFILYREQIVYDREDVFEAFDQCIKIGEEFFRLCTMQECEKRIDEGKAKESENTQFARFVLVYSCMRSAQIVMNVEHSEQSENIVLQWCAKVKTYLPRTKNWIVFDSGISYKTDGPFSFDTDARTCGSECEKIERHIREQQQIRANSHTGNVTQREMAVANYGANSAEKNRIRDGYGEVQFPSGGSYKGEWKAGKPNGFGIKTDAFGKVTCGVFENGELKKNMAKIKVSIILKMLK